MGVDELVLATLDHGRRYLGAVQAAIDAFDDGVRGERLAGPGFEVAGVHVDRQQAEPERAGDGAAPSRHAGSGCVS